MNFAFFIAKRITSLSRSYPGSAIVGTRPIIRIATASVALGTAVMITALAVLSGFKKEIREKVIGFGSHIQITAFSADGSYEQKPVGKMQPFYSNRNLPEGVRHVQVFATKAGIIKTENEIEGIILKGTGSDFDWNFFDNNIIAGKSFRVNDSVRSDDIILSRYTAKRLNLKPGDKIAMFFIQNPPRARKFTVSGLYETGFEEFDKLFALCDIAHIQKLNGWSDEQVGGFEILVNDFTELWKIHGKVSAEIPFDMQCASIVDLYPQIFGWLELQDTNVVIIIALMLLVTGMNMISALLILILERTRMIGILKALGAGDKMIGTVFLLKGGWLMGTGILSGNIIGIGLCFIQKQFNLIHLDQASYYVSAVPVHIDPVHILILNTGTFFLCMIMLIAPAYIISRLSPVKALRFG
ncbi:MAG: ABC transporter permease [Bacteroidetes bacterium]|nr:ABC transporter permease [Bacteroidota bacterium]